MMVHNIQQVHITILAKTGMQGETEQAMIAPVTNFLADIQDRRTQSNIILKNPDPAIPVPLVHGSDFIEGNADCTIPVTSDLSCDEICRQNCAGSLVRRHP